MTQTIVREYRMDDKSYRAVLTIDIDRIVSKMARKAIRSKGRKATMIAGAIVVKVKELP